MTYSSREINRNFRLKVAGFHEGRKINTLVGVSGLIRLIGEDFAEKFTCKAMAMLTDSHCFKLRRGIRVTFYIK